MTTSPLHIDDTSSTLKNSIKLSTTPSTISDDQQRRERAQRYLDSLKQSSLGKKLDLQQPVKEKSESTTFNTLEDEEDDDDGEEEEESKRNTIHSLLQKDITMSKGKVFQNIASTFMKRIPTNPAQVIKSLSKGKSHNMIPTASEITKCAKWIWTTYKSGTTIKWNIKEAKAALVLPKPSKSSGHLLCLAISPDDRYVVTGCSKGHLVLRSAADGRILERIEGKHRASVTGMKFIQCSSATPTLFTSSMDRTVKIWNICEDDVVFDDDSGAGVEIGLFSSSNDNDVDNDNASTTETTKATTNPKVTLLYVDTLFGHQDGIMAIDCLQGERCVTVGARDRTARFWKVPEESQLIFRANEGRSSNDGGSLDAVAMIDNEHFVSGSDSGLISLFALHKKKPLCFAFSANSNSNAGDADGNTGTDIYSPITALHSVLLTDVLISATQDGSGEIVFWKVGHDFKSLEEMGRLKVDHGSSIITSITVDDDLTKIVLSLSKEPRMGRWNVVGKDGRNSVLVVPLL